MNQMMTSLLSVYRVKLVCVCVCVHVFVCVNEKGDG